MHVAVLCPYSHEIERTFALAGDDAAVVERIEDAADAEFVVSYGHRHIIREPHLTRYAGRIINLHISRLPWNRGSDPNFWAWFDGTPQGVTIHELDGGLDTGPILAARDVETFGTLNTSYTQLRAAMASLFAEAWPDIRAGKRPPMPQNRGEGSYHRVADKAPFWARLPRGYDTPVEEVRRIGSGNRR